MTRDDPTRVPAILADIRRFGIAAARVVARGPEQFSDPDDDDQRRIARSVIVDLSIAADRLPQAFRDDHPKIDWQGIRAVRNFVAHDDGTDEKLLWRAIAVEVPRILGALGIES